MNRMQKLGGLLAGWFAGGRGDRLIRSLAGALAAVPEFLVAIGLLLLFAIRLDWFPLYGGRTPFADPADGLVEEAADVVWHLTLPAAALVLTGAAGFLLLARDAATGVRREPWLTAARAKGLREREVVTRHAWPWCRYTAPGCTDWKARLPSTVPMSRPSSSAMRNSSDDPLRSPTDQAGAPRPAQ